MILRISRHTVSILGYGALGALIALVSVYLYRVDSWPDPQLWHEVVLEQEFTADRAGEIQGLEDYLQLEDRLFEELYDKVYKQVPPLERRQSSRYTAGSPVDPQEFEVNWNRTFEMPVEDPIGGVLMLHGLSDSPYSMRALAETLHDQGFWVVGLRLPGHGAAPAGLRDVHWQDFTAATRMAARYLGRRVGPDRSLFITGYSNGAALAVEYCLGVLEGEDLPAVDALVLISPAITVSPVATLARWQRRLGHALGWQKLDWTSLLPEFDPYKYNSFAINAGEQIHDLTTAIADRLDALLAKGELHRFPPVLAFQSVVDSTVPPQAVVDGLLRKLGGGGHQLVLFDLNRRSEVQPFLRAGTGDLGQDLLAEKRLPFDLTLVGNRSPQSSQIVARRRSPGRARIREEVLGMTWPPGVYSLSHLALPFSADDPIYGANPRGDDGIIDLGALEVRGETGVLVVPGRYFIRLRYNPFYPYLEYRVVRTLTDLADNR